MQEIWDVPNWNIAPGMQVVTVQVANFHSNSEICQNLKRCTNR